LDRFALPPNRIILHFAMVPVGYTYFPVSPLPNDPECSPELGNRFVDVGFVVSDRSGPGTDQTAQSPAPSITEIHKSICRQPSNGVG
jgi:hypothetical protein